MADASGRVVGYYTLSAYTIRLTELPPELAKRFPKYPLLPATLLGRLAVNREHQTQKLGRILLMDALKRSLKYTHEIASVAVVVEAYDDQARNFYRRHEFTPLIDRPDKLFLAMRTIESAFS